MHVFEVFNIPIHTVVWPIFQGLLLSSLKSYNYILYKISFSYNMELICNLKFQPRPFIKEIDLNLNLNLDLKLRISSTSTSALTWKSVQRSYLVHLIIFEDIYIFWICFELMLVILMECLYKIQLKLTRKQFKLDGRAFSLGFIFSLKCTFGLDFGNIITQTNKL